ncbi:hypothetical protein OIE67_48605 [Nonomuraea fuscirosea]|jgi:hypothetical protein|uniref:hypothetical protein n=1 Tax=Nonomuraea fuscirosea TaxID=1291556 RepID=UPI002DDC284F|nr:hypothetical protein [Nonomuraea fuscirosea]WSA51817.1 hypothetical protein OIE67_48605 [Nonomuraea fuscirosea]
MRFLRWWAASLVVCVLTFLLLLSQRYVPGGEVWCAGPLSSFPEDTWVEQLRARVLNTIERVLLANALPSVCALLSGVVAVWAGRRVGVVVGVLAGSVMLVVTLMQVLEMISFVRLLDCAGWDGRLPWLALLASQPLGYGVAAGLLGVGVRVRWRAG